MARWAIALVAVLGIAAAALALRGGAADVTPTPFSLNAAQAQEVGVLTGFLDAFNHRRLQRALGYLTNDATISDCNYRHVSVVQVKGRSSITRWLKRRFGDRDTLTLGRVYNENSEHPFGVLAVEFARRTSKTLRALGFPHGITPRLVAKTIFTQAGAAKITRFANGPFGGSLDACRPQ